MKSLSARAYSCTVIIFLQIEFLARSENLPPNQALSDRGFTQMSNGRAPREPMTCHACSTMDYENPLDNPCRRILLPEKATLQPHIQISPNQLHFAKPVTTTTTTTTTTTESTRNYQDLAHPAEALVMTTTMFDGSSTAGVTPAYTTSSYDYSQAEHGRTDTNIVNASLTSRANSHTRSHANTSRNDLMINSNRHINSRRYKDKHDQVLHRRCEPDENFCSIVSVVRIEFVQDKVYSKFWALERNCSRSCNTGCMMIGERVRLRVCSQCCQTPDCNNGNGGVTTIFEPTHINLVIALCLVLQFIITQHCSSNNTH